MSDLRAKCHDLRGCVRDAAEAGEALGQVTSAQDAGASERLRIALRSLIDDRPA